MLAAAAWLGAGLLPGRAALRQQSPATLRVALRLQERADPAQSWASSYNLASEEVTIETSSSTAGPLEAYETAEKPAVEGVVRAAEERADVASPEGRPLLGYARAGNVKGRGKRQHE